MHQRRLPGASVFERRWFPDSSGTTENRCCRPENARLQPRLRRRRRQPRRCRRAPHRLALATRHRAEVPFALGVWPRPLRGVVSISTTECPGVETIPGDVAGHVRDVETDRQRGADDPLGCAERLHFGTAVPPPTSSRVDGRSPTAVSVRLACGSSNFPVRSGCQPGRRASRACVSFVCRRESTAAARVAP